MQIYAYTDLHFIFLCTKNPEWAENVKMRDVAAPFPSNGHFSKITKLSLAKKIGQTANFFLDFL